MTLEKDKIYKIKHNNYFGLCRRNEIIFSPINDVEIPKGFFGEYSNCAPIRSIDTHFTVCFDKTIRTKYDIRGSQTGLDRNCVILDITDEDYSYIRKVIERLENRYKYNRKLNKIILCE